ncbi:tunicamycin resistance protein [Kappamyces sp. JEL0829]|nr:tunicamycin resistance protein [Kappamyces sp. JEL0829]
MFVLLVSFLLSLVAFCLVYFLIPLAIPLFIKQGLKGKDVLKPKAPVIAESMGVIVGVVYFCLLFLFIPLPFWDWVMKSPLEAIGPFPHHKLAQFVGGLLSMFTMLFLGFADDVLDIKWRVKIWFPLIASIPLLMVYFVTYGNTDVLVPLPLRFLFASKFVAGRIT